MKRGANGASSSRPFVAAEPWGDWKFEMEQNPTSNLIQAWDFVTIGDFRVCWLLKLQRCEFSEGYQICVNIFFPISHGCLVS